MDYYEGVGRRKRATARVRLFPGGDGSIVVNERPLDEYFSRDMPIILLKEPLKVSSRASAGRP